MGRILMLPQSSADMAAKGLLGDNRSLPLNYMSDHSIMALRVDRLAAARTILEKEHLLLVDTPAGPEVTVAGAEHLRRLLWLLNGQGVEAVFTEVATETYQG